MDIGSEDGFLQGGRLIYKANTTTRDYHSQINLLTLQTGLGILPSLPPNSVVVIDNVLYHGIQEDKVPNKSATKKVMLE